MMSVMGQKSKSKRRHENKQQARENSSKPGETQESVENIRFLEWPKNFYVPDGVGVCMYVYIYIIIYIFIYIPVPSLLNKKRYGGR